MLRSLCIVAALAAIAAPPLSARAEDEPAESPEEPPKDGAQEGRGPSKRRASPPPRTEAPSEAEKPAEEEPSKAEAPSDAEKPAEEAPSKTEEPPEEDPPKGEKSPEEETPKGEEPPEEDPPKGEEPPQESPDEEPPPPPPEPPVQKPPVVELKGLSFVGGEVPRAERFLARAQPEVAACVQKHGGVAAARGTLDMQLLVRSRGRAGGVEVLGRSHVSGDAGRCVRRLLKGRWMGSPSQDPVGVTFRFVLKRRYE
jgi:hypothetical protein